MRGQGLGVLALVLAASSARAAGTVSVTVSGGQVIVQGDEAPNGIAIVGTGTAGEALVAGLDGTRVNGGEAVTVGGLRRLTVRMSGGADRVELRQVTIPGRASVRLDAGDDTFLMEQARVRGRLTVSGGRGWDRVSVGPTSRVGGQLHVRGGRDPDAIDVAGTVTGGLVVATGPGDDVAVLRDLDVRGPTLLFTGPGEDDVVVENVDFRRRVRMNLGNADDTLRLEDVAFEGDADLDGGDDDDVLIVRGFADFEDDLDVDDFELSG